MNTSYQLFVGIDVSKGKADAAILQVSDLRSVEPKFLRKKLSFNYFASSINEFLSKVRTYCDEDCTQITFAMEVTGVYSDNPYHFILNHLNSNESIHFLDTDFVNQWRNAHNISKSDPLDAQTISTIIGTDDKVRYVHDSVFSNEKGYRDLKCLSHRYDQCQKNLRQELNRLIAQCDRTFPELQYVFDPKSAVFLAILSAYPTTHDIINASKEEVFSLAFEASKHKVKFDKIDNLFSLCQDTIVYESSSQTIYDVIHSIVESVKECKLRLKEVENNMISLACQFPAFDLLCSIPGCGKTTAAVIIAEIGDINRFKNANQLVSYAGLAPRNKRSGSSVDIMGKISKKGSKYLRHALFMVAEFARRHNPILEVEFKRIKAGNKKRHKLAVIAVANKIARYIYSVLKTKTAFVIENEHINRLPEETRISFFTSIQFNIPENTRKKIYYFRDALNQVRPFIYKSKDEELAI